MPIVQHEDGTAFLVPSGKENDEDYLSRAYELAKPGKPAIPNELGGHSGFATSQGRYENKAGMDTMSAPDQFVQDRMNQIGQGILGTSNSEGRAKGISDIIRGTGSLAAPALLPEAAISAPGITAASMLTGGLGAAAGKGIAHLLDLSPGAMDLSEDAGGIIGGLPTGISPKVRAGMSEGLSSAGRELSHPPSMRGMLNRGSLPTLIGSLLGSTVNHPIIGAEAGAATGLAGKAASEGIMGAARGVSNEPRIFNWSESIKPNVSRESGFPGAPSEYSYDGVSKNPINPEVLPPQNNPEVFSYGGAATNRQLPPGRSPLSDMFHTTNEEAIPMPGNIESKYPFPGAPFMEHPPLALPPASMIGHPIPMPAAGSHILNPQELKGLPPSSIWEETSQIPNRTRGAIPMGGDVQTELGSKIKVGQTGNKIPTPKVNPPKVSESPTVKSPKIEAPKAEPAKANKPIEKVENAKNTPAKDTKVTDSKTSETSKGKDSKVTEEAKNTLTSPETSVDPKGADKYISMTDASAISKEHGIDYLSTVKHLKSMGYEVVSDFDMDKKVSGSYGLNAKGRKLP